MKMGWKMTLNISVVLLLIFISCTESITFLGRSTTYSRFPKWNACVNSSLSFDFKTTSSTEQLLMYTDDNGRYDFFQLALVSGQVRLWMNLADEQDGVVELLVGKALNDGAWHHVKVRRNRMNTTLFVDTYQSSMMSFGQDFLFGDPNQSTKTNTFVKQNPLLCNDDDNNDSDYDGCGGGNDDDYNDSDYDGCGGGNDDDNNDSDYDGCGGGNDDDYNDSDYDGCGGGVIDNNSHLPSHHLTPFANAKHEYFLDPPQKGCKLKFKVGALKIQKLASCHVGKPYLVSPEDLGTCER
ncbi:contactin-associated protein like 5-1-like [Gigantopelta aegis]|uniref:contactin-associated protein like 5-1-like n=1 Tax=Gigantopelta aegis TaxID=1735272 RepID=UPI001B88A510|nr:contactin-associated protein like 5-1-like [Gigantopelta aegis]